MSRWGLMDGVADLPANAFNENKFARTYEGGGGGGGSPSPTFGPGMTQAESAALAKVSGGTPAPTTAGPTAGRPYAAAPMAPNNPYQQAAMAQQGALTGTAAAGLTNIGTLAGTNITPYMNPYTQQVIAANEADILRGAQMGINALDTAAGRAGAFGGSRHGVAMGELGTGVAQQLAQSSAGLRQAGFQQAQTAAQQDIQNRLSQANLGLAGALQLGNLGQQSFGYGQAVNQGLAQQGAQQQAMNQAIIDAAKQQFAAYTGQPMASLGTVSAALGATPMAQSTQTTKTPGLFDYLTLAASMAGGK